MNTEALLEVRTRILAEPKSLNMGVWEERRGGFWGQLVGCGTVCCIAGHAIAARGGSVRGMGGMDRNSDIVKIAASLLGIAAKEANLLFYFHKPYEGSPYYDLGLKLGVYRPGSMQYAEVVAQAIDLCISRDGGHVSEKKEKRINKDKEFAESVGISL